MNDSEWLNQLADDFDNAPRYGLETDEPEGLRYVRVSDTLIKMITERFREIANRLEPETVPA